MAKVAEQLAAQWRSQLADYKESERESIVLWLLGADQDRFEDLGKKDLEVIQQGLDFRYRILVQRYLKVSPTQAYRNLINRLGSLIVLRQKIRTWVSLSRDRQRAVADVIQEVIQEMLKSDRYIQQQIAWIDRCTQNSRLKNNLLLASMEEYCLRPIRNQPLISYRFFNYLRRQEKGGMTQVPQQETVQILSEELNLDETNSPVSLLDRDAIAEYQESQDWEIKQALREEVKREFTAYLEAKIGQVAVGWLELYLHGSSQEEIAKTLNLPIKQVYRLREKVGYHALKVFALKIKPELVANWLEISLQEHNLGLTPQQWQVFYADLTPTQQHLIAALKGGQSVESLAKRLNWKINQVMSEWTKIYLVAQEKRNLFLI